MKYLIILGDGMGDFPIESLGNKTPLQAAKKPHIDLLAKRGRNGLFATVPLDMPPGSEIANMAVLGYDVKKVFQGRGVLEAASMGVELVEGDLALRCNLICIEDEKIKNHSAGHIGNEEAHELIGFLQKELGNERITFYPGVSYRHLVVIRGGNNDLYCTPPHDVPGTRFEEVLPVSKAWNEASDLAEGMADNKTVGDIGLETETSKLVKSLILRSQELLKDHPINVKRREAGKDPANSIWPWSPGHKPAMKTLQEQYGIKGAMISAVDLLYGIGIYAGMTPIKVPGSTGLYDTNYEGKAEAAVKALKDHDLVYLHIEASDEAGHEGDAELKKRTIEYLDHRVVRYILEETEKMEEEVVIAITPDHATPCVLRTHTHDPVPFIIHHPGVEPDEVDRYDEESAKKGSYGLISGDEFIRALLKR
jgi:2,3-bisphosphoglycerate-independent phosphoglycerate mutase